MMSLVFWLMIVSMAIVVLPMARSPMISSRWPRPSANSVSTTTRPVCTGWVTRSRSMIAGAGRSIGSSVSLAIGPFAVERAAERIDDAAEQRRSDRHAHDVAGAAHGVAGLDRIDVVQQHAADPVALEHLGEAELALLEAQQFVEPDVGQAGDQRDAVADLLDPADLFGLRPERGRRRALRGRVRARRRLGRQARLSWVRSARIRVRSARQLLLTTRCGPCSSRPAISAGSVLKAICGWPPNALPISVAVALLFGRIERRGADRFERDAVAAIACRAASGRRPDLPEQPIEERLAHRRAVQPRGQALGDVDREAARPLGPGLVGRLPLLLDRRLRGSLPATPPASRPRPDSAARVRSAAS